MKVRANVKHWTVLLLIAAMIFATMPAYAATAGEEESEAAEIVAYVSKQFQDTYELSNNVTVLTPNRVDGTISTSWKDASTQWTWTTNQNYVVDTDYRPLYTKCAGASIMIDMGKAVAGEYDFYYYTIQAAGAVTNAMELVVSQGDSQPQTVSVPAMSQLSSGSATIAGWTKVGTVTLNGADNVIVSYTAPEGVTNARATAVKLVPVTGEPEDGEGEEALTAKEVVVYAGANGAKEKSDAFTGTPDVGGGWGQHTSQWVWSGQRMGCEQYPLYTHAEGAAFTFDLGQLASGMYEVAYYTVTAATPEMQLTVREGDTDAATVTVPEYAASNNACWLTVGTVKLSGTGNVTVNYTNPADTINARATGVKLTLIEDTVSGGDIVKSATVEADCTQSKDDLAWSTSKGLKNYDGGNTLYTIKINSTITFHVGEIASGNYKVYYWVTPHTSNLDEMPLTVNHGGEEAKVNVPIGGDAAAGWYYMGTLNFTGDGSETVDFVHPGGVEGASQARGTAVKLTPTDHGVYVPKEVVVEDSDTSDVIIDVDPYPGFSFIGDWATSSTLPGPMSKSAYSMWISKSRIDSSLQPYNNPAENYCQYKPDLQVTAGVNISVYLLYWKENQTNDVIYEVHHNGEVDTFHIDMTKLTESGWHDLGKFDFSGDPETNFVRVVCTDADNYGELTNFRASTVRFDVLNDAASGGIWQTVYVTPSKTGEIFVVAELDQFEDIADDDVMKYDVEYMYNEGFITGTSETAFSPEENITKTDFMSYLSKVLDLTDKDTVADMLLNGVGEDESLTKEEIAQILNNAVAWLNKNVGWLHSLTPDYRQLDDAEDVSDWAVNAVDVMYRCGIVTTTDGALLPQKVMTRAEAVVMLKQFTQQFVKSGPVNDDGEDWVLTFNEEFQGTELDTNVWTAMNENPSHILSSRHPENVEVYDGAVHLVTKYESKVEGKSWTTGNILADKGAFVQEYGYWEARYKYTESAGINNSFWMMSTGTKDNTWYEIDVCEGHYMNKINTNLHEYTTGARLQHSERYTTQYDLSEDYHTYAVEWTPEYLKYYFDGQLIHTKTNVTEGGHLSFARLSSAILSWAGAITTSADGTAQVADYVRVWQRSGEVADHTVANEYALDGMSACVLEKVEAVNANCIDSGLKEHWKCTICNKYFADAEGTTEIDKADVTVAALGGEHEYVVTDSKAAACLEDGYMVETCAKCGDVKNTVFTAAGHTAETLPGKAATCTESGLADGEKCSVCGEVITAQTVLPAIGQTEIPATGDSDQEVVIPSITETDDSGNAEPVITADTGDYFNNIWYLLLVVSTVGTVILVRNRRKCKQP